jgi:hypothetical protein
VEHIRVRSDTAGALVRLEDGRHAITGATLTVGHPADLVAYATARRAAQVGAAERAWWTALTADLARAP